MFYFQESFQLRHEAWFTYILTALAIFMGIMMGGQLVGQHFSLLVVCKFSQHHYIRGGRVVALILFSFNLILFQRNFQNTCNIL